MVGAKKALLKTRYLAALARLPPDHLRPTLQLRDALHYRLEKRGLFPADSTARGPAAEAAQLAALLALLSNRYRNRNPLGPGHPDGDPDLLTATDSGGGSHGSGSGSETTSAGPGGGGDERTAWYGCGMMQPRSHPTYYLELEQDLEEAPERSWLERLRKRLAGLVRWS